MKSTSSPETTGRAAPLALVAAGGEGKRLGADGPKALVLCAGRPLLAWSLDALAESERFGNGAGLVVVAAHESDLQTFEGACEPAREAGLKIVVAAGGSSRSHSVSAALAVGLTTTGDPATERTVLVHDAARIFTTAALIDGMVNQLESDEGTQALVAAAPVTDTIKQVHEDGRVYATPARESLWAVQTPQVFEAGWLARALGAPDDVLTKATDDASIVEDIGGVVKVYPWNEPNGKITTPSDLASAEQFLQS
jgi:2-C-methyl-D-erythritol 4-phosphate cytidylyltransferase